MVHEMRLTVRPGQCFVAIVFLLSLATAASGQLSQDYYAQSCPNVESIARSSFLNRVSFFNILALPANILRLAFHDCAVDGCDASILLDSSADGSITDEKNSANNVGIGNIAVVEYMKQQIDAQCKDSSGAPVVSCADVIALAGREAFNFAKGLGNLGQQIIPIPLGRRDGTTAQTSHADSQLLPPTTSVDTLLSNFARIGLTTEQAVALMGSHTIGIAHCVNIVNRLYPSVDSTLALPINIPLVMKLKLACPDGSYNGGTVVNNDQTNSIFDNQYFANVMVGQGLMTVDDNLRQDSRTSGYVQQFALNVGYFYQTFAEAYTVLTSWQALTGTNGQIRTDCTKVNSS